MQTCKARKVVLIHRLGWIQVDVEHIVSDVTAEISGCRIPCSNRMCGMVIIPASVRKVGSQARELKVPDDES